MPSLTVLDKIVAKTRTDLEERKRRHSLDFQKAAAQDAPGPRSFFGAIADDPAVSLIAEVKKASPSKGVIRDDFDPVAIAKTYAENGAACISVLTDEPFFQGSLDYLRAIRNAVEVPLLRKDFILDDYQVWEARAAGADAVLLIAECLDDCRLRALHNLVIELGMTPLVEFYEPGNCPRVLEAGAQLIGVNNRDLRTFETDLNHTVRMRAQVPEECLLVGESGIRTHEDVRMLGSHGVDAVLVGESLMAQADVGRAVRELLSGAKKS